MRKSNIFLYLVASSLFISVNSSSQTPDSAPGLQSTRGRVAELSKRASNGDTKAQLEMGLAYEFGDGVAKDIDKAMHWYRVAADRGDPIAQADLGYLYETGANGPKDPVEAAKWYMRAALSGLTRAKFNLGVLYLEGAGVQRSMDEAAHWIGEAADDGCPSALVSMSYLYANGLGVPRDPQRGADLKQRAEKSRKNDTKICMSLNPRSTPTSVASAGAGIK